MKPAILLLFISFFATFISMPFIISFSIKKRFYDDPKDDALKIHNIPVPVLGGVGVFLGFVISLFFLMKAQDSKDLVAIIIGSLLIISLGLWDDLRDVKHYTRLVLQCLIAGLTIFFGIKINSFPQNYLAIPITIVYILGTINAVNLLDGLDGLASGVVSISLIGFSILFNFQNNYLYMFISIALLGSVMGFLPYNFNPARIFLGDNGSTFLGYILAILTITASSVPYDLTLFIVPLLLIGLPIIDTVTAILRRALKGKPIFVGDRSHIYDQLVDKGLSVKKAVLTCYSMQILLVAGAIYWAIRYS